MIKNNIFFITFLACIIPYITDTMNQKEVTKEIQPTDEMKRKKYTESKKKATVLFMAKKGLFNKKNSIEKNKKDIKKNIKINGKKNKKKKK